MMNLYKVEGYNGGYDTYDSFICVAPSEESARQTHPSEYVTHITEGRWMGTYSGGVSLGKEYDNDDCLWCSFKDIRELVVTRIGTADARYSQGEVLVASFNAG